MPKNTPLIKDWLAFGFLTGSALSLAKTVASSLLGKTGIHTMPFGRTAADLIVGNSKTQWWSPQRRARKRDDAILGSVADTLMGGVYGAATSYLISLSPPGNELAKGAMAGALFSIATMAAGRRLKVGGLKSLDPTQALGMIVSGTLFGAIQGLALARYGSGMIIQSHPVLTKPVDDHEFEQGRSAISMTH